MDTNFTVLDRSVLAMKKRQRRKKRTGILIIGLLILCLTTFILYMLLRWANFLADKTSILLESTFEEKISDVRFSEDGTRLGIVTNTGQQNSYIYIWSAPYQRDATAWNLVSEFRPETEFDRLVFSPDNMMLYVAGIYFGQPSIMRWDLNNQGSELAPLEEISPDSLYVEISDNIIVDRSTEIRRHNFTRDFDYTNEHQLIHIYGLSFGCPSPEYIIWDTRTEEINRLPVTDINRFIESDDFIAVRHSGSGTCGSQLSYVTIWQDDRQITRLDSGGDIEISANGQYLTSANYRMPSDSYAHPEFVVQIYHDFEFAYTYPLAVSNTSYEFVADSEISDDGQFLYLLVHDISKSGSANLSEEHSKIHIISLETGTLNKTILLDAVYNQFDLHPDGQQVALVTLNSRTLRIIKVRP